MKKEDRYPGRIDFGMKSTSIPGIVSSCLAGTEILLFLGAIYWSYLREGNAGAVLGAAGAAIFVLSVIGMVVGFCGSVRKGFYHTADYFGMAANLAALIGICILFVYGTMI